VLALTAVDEAMRRRVTRSDVEYIALDKGPGHLFSHYPRLLGIFRRLQPAIVHTRNLAALEASVPARLARVGAVVHGEHGRDADDIEGRNVRYRWVRRVYSPFVTRYVALSLDLQRYLVDGVGILPSRISQLYNGVDCAAFAPAGRERAGIDGFPFADPHFFVVGTVGRLDAVKDQTNLARAFVSALRRHPQARDRLRLVVVGEGRLRAEVERILDDAEAADLAWLPGERHDIADLMRALDCFVLPSLSEGISNTLLEAMASGLPVVATRVGGNAELMEEGLTGRLVPRADHEALATEMLRYFDQPQLARRHGRAGRDLVEKRFSIEAMVRRYDELYTQVLRRSAPAPATLVQSR